MIVGAYARGLYISYFSRVGFDVVFVCCGGIDHLYCHVPGCLHG